MNVDCDYCPFQAECDNLYDTFSRNFCDSKLDEIARLRRNEKNE